MQGWRWGSWGWGLEPASPSWLAEARPEHRERRIQAPPANRPAPTFLSRLYCSLTSEVLGFPSRVRVSFWGDFSPRSCCLVS